MEPFLARGVPDLELDLLASQLDCFDLEVDADGGDEGRVEGVVRKPEEDASLTDAGVADQKQFEQQIVRLLGHFLLLFPM